MATPNQMPHKSNPLQQQVLGGLIKTKKVSRTFKTLGKSEDGKERVVETKYTVQELRYPLAQNVSDASIERMAKRWIG